MPSTEENSVKIKVKLKQFLRKMKVFNEPHGSIKEIIGYAESHKKFASYFIHDFKNSIQDRVHMCKKMVLRALIIWIVL